MSEDLRYLPVADIRREIAAMVGIQTERYRENRGFIKSDLYAVAEAIGDPPDDLTLVGLYKWVCDATGVEYNETGGNQWKLSRPQLKAIHRTIDCDECRGCGRPLGAGYLCDDCDTVEVET